MQGQLNKPIFIVGSPRSGTSILTWCLGKHANIFPVPESNWMGEFGLNVAASYQMGIARGDRTILSAMDISREEFFANFGRSINDLILRHRLDLEKKRKMTRPPTEPKMRWVDGTPEYSLHIYALRKLFPEAVFIHVLRDPPEVVRSMLNFHRVAGTHLVQNEEQAYKYWLRMVKACVQAEQAYGSEVVHRLSYIALIDDPERAIRSLLEFVGEPYSAKCLIRSADASIVPTYRLILSLTTLLPTLVSSRMPPTFTPSCKKLHSQQKHPQPSLMKLRLRSWSECNIRRP